MIARLQREGVDESSDDKFGDSDCLWGGSMGCRPAAASYTGRAVFLTSPSLAESLVMRPEPTTI